MKSSMESHLTEKIFLLHLAVLTFIILVLVIMLIDRQRIISGSVLGLVVDAYAVNSN